MTTRGGMANGRTRQLCLRRVNPRCCRIRGLRPVQTKTLANRIQRAVTKVVKGTHQPGLVAVRNEHTARTAVGQHEDRNWWLLCSGCNRCMLERTGEERQQYTSQCEHPLEGMQAREKREVGHAHPTDENAIVFFHEAVIHQAIQCGHFL